MFGKCRPGTRVYLINVCFLLRAMVNGVSLPSRGNPQIAFEQRTHWGSESTEHIFCDIYNLITSDSIPAFLERQQVASCKANCREIIECN